MIGSLRRLIQKKKTGCTKVQPVFSYLIVRRLHLDNAQYVGDRTQQNDDNKERAQEADHEPEDPAAPERIRFAEARESALVLLR